MQKSCLTSASIVRSNRYLLLLTLILELYTRRRNSCVVPYLAGLNHLFVLYCTMYHIRVLMLLVPTGQLVRSGNYKIDQLGDDPV